MSIYNSDANNSSFSILGNTTPSTSSRSSRGSRGSGRSGRSGKSSNLLNTTAQIGSTPIAAPNVVGLTRLEAINLLIAEGFDYIVSYTTTSATSQNNDTVASQSTADLVIVLNVYQYVAVPGRQVITNISTLSQYLYISDSLDGAFLQPGDTGFTEGQPYFFANYPVTEWGGTLVQNGYTPTFWVGKYIKFNNLSSALDNNYYLMSTKNSNSAYLTYSLIGMPSLDTIWAGLYNVNNKDQANRRVNLNQDALLSIDLAS